MSPASNPAVPAPGALLRQVVVPVEHGGWAFLAEPILLGLLLAPSAGGLLLALGSLAAFLARQPLRLAVMDRRRGRRYPRTRIAERAFAAGALLAALAVAGAALTARAPFLLALALAAPFGATALAFDLGRRSRDLAHEIAGALALAFVAPAILLAGGWKAAPALALWGVLAARIVPTILYVRARLRLERGEPARTATALAAQLGGFAVGVALAGLGLAPWLGAGALAVLALRGALGLSSHRPRWSTKQLGASEAVFGALAVFAIAAGISWRI